MSKSQTGRRKGILGYSPAGRRACLHHKPGPRSAATPSTPSPAAGSGRSGTWRWSGCLCRFQRWSQCCQRSSWWETKSRVNPFVLVPLTLSALPSPTAGSLPSLSESTFSWVVPVNDQTPPLVVCRIRRWSRPAVVYYNFKSATKHIMVQRPVRNEQFKCN